MASKAEVVARAMFRAYFFVDDEDFAPTPLVWYVYAAKVLRAQSRHAGRERKVRAGARALQNAMVRHPDDRLTLTLNRMDGRTFYTAPPLPTYVVCSRAALRAADHYRKEGA